MRMRDLTSTGRGKMSWNKQEACKDDEFTVEWFHNDVLTGEPKGKTCVAVPAALDNGADGETVMDFLSQAVDKLPKSKFSIRAEGSVSLVEGEYRFGTHADRSQRVFVDGEKVLESWSDKAEEHWSCPQSLAGPHVLRFEYRRGAGADGNKAARAALKVRKTPVCMGQWTVNYFKGESSACGSCDNFLETACHEELNF